ncbi:hypothetical protein TRVA0_017S02718 [Trichomonascus vanleenenianus]|uniref:uncharacterized protein n=1 Tax=Trichomonascus vanleenenianus TaxID=2268995 RepID=UPI003ECA4725
MVYASLWYLPDELLSIVADYSSPRDAYSLHHTCQRFRKVLGKRMWGHLALDLRIPPGTNFTKFVDPGEGFQVSTTTAAAFGNELVASNLNGMLNHIHDVEIIDDLPGFSMKYHFRKCWRTWRTRKSFARVNQARVLTFLILELFLLPARLPNLESVRINRLITMHSEADETVLNHSLRLREEAAPDKVQIRISVWTAGDSPFWFTTEDKFLWDHIETLCCHEGSLRRESRPEIFRQQPPRSVLAFSVTSLSPFTASTLKGLLEGFPGLRILALRFTSFPDARSVNWLPATVNYLLMQDMSQEEPTKCDKIVNNYSVRHLTVNSRFSTALMAMRFNSLEVLEINAQLTSTVTLLPFIDSHALRELHVTSDIRSLCYALPRAIYGNIRFLKIDISKTVKPFSMTMLDHFISLECADIEVLNHKMPGNFEFVMRNATTFLACCPCIRVIRFQAVAIGMLSEDELFDMNLLMARSSYYCFTLYAESFLSICERRTTSCKTEQGRAMVQAARVSLPIERRMAANYSR